MIWGDHWGHGYGRPRPGSSRLRRPGVPGPARRHRRVQRRLPGGPAAPRDRLHGCGRRRVADGVGPPRPPAPALRLRRVHPGRRPPRPAHRRGAAAGPRDRAAAAAHGLRDRPGARAGAGAHVLRLAGRAPLPVDAVRAPPVGARCTPPSPTSSTRSSATPTSSPARAWPTSTRPPARRRCARETDAGAGLLLAGLLVLDRVRRAVGGRRAADVRLRDPVVVGRARPLPRGRDPAVRPPGHGDAAATTSPCTSRCCSPPGRSTTPSTSSWPSSPPTTTTSTGAGSQALHPPDAA